MRITILAHVEPGSGETFSDAVGQVAAGLRKGSHRVSILGACHQIGKLISGLKRRQPDLVFNMMGQDHEEGRNAVAVTGLLDVLGVPFTGCGPGEAYIQLDPGLTSSLLGEWTAFVGGIREIEPNGVSTNGHRVRTFQVGVVGNCELTTFPAVENRYDRTDNCHDGSDTELDGRLRCVAKSAYQALRVRDYGFVDVKLGDHNRPIPTGVRNHCDLGQNGLLARSAAAVGLDHSGLVNRIVDSAFERAEQRKLVRLI